MRQMLCKHRCFLVVVSNFRYDIYPEYKANRKDMQRPKWLQVVREHLVTDWKATVTDGIEADDAMGIAQCTEHDGDSMICSIDKDMLMIPGHHYNFVNRSSVWFLH
jgi:5'-3' exonuclease